jgi:hypothetical protein
MVFVAQPDRMALAILIFLFAAAVVLLCLVLWKWSLVRSEQTWAGVLGVVGSVAGAIGIQPSRGVVVAWILGGAGIIASLALAIHAELKEHAKQRPAPVRHDDGANLEAGRVSMPVEAAVASRIAAESVDRADPQSEPDTADSADSVDADGDEFDEFDETSVQGPRDSTVFFSDRFAQAFPGVRGIRLFRQPVANERLLLLLKQPLSLRLDDRTTSSPIWFWGRGDMHIHAFSVEPPELALLDVHELIIDEVAAVNPGSYYQQFVYVKTRPSPPSGLYDGDIGQQVAWRGYADEELGLYRGRYITRAEYDDGAAEIDGKPVDVRGEVRLRKRYLTSFNFLIAAQFSPLNNVKADREITALLNGILRGERTLEDLKSFVCELPKRTPFSREP